MGVGSDDGNRLGGIVVKGIVYKAQGDMQVEEVEDPAIQDAGDAIVKVTKASICGSDLHIYNHGDAFGFETGCRVGHEFVGTVEEVGSGVSHVRPGDKVLAPFWISCGSCHFCQKGLQTSCVSGGCFGFQSMFPGGGEGHAEAVEGGQSQYVRVPMAGGTLDRIPDPLAADADDMKTLPLTDVFGTGYHAAKCSGVEAGSNVVVIGDGAVGLCGAHAARALGAETIMVLGHHDDRLAIAEQMGATHTVNTKTSDDAEELANELSGGLGPDAVIAAISSPNAMQWAMDNVQPGGGIGWVGMEVFLGAPEIPWDQSFFKNVTISGGVAPVKSYLPELWPMLEAGAIDPSPVLTHDLSMDEAASGYGVMADREEGSVKVAISPQA
jgi:threonine dehydrogenase-like Zn-dependent dehydrogenase